jgi:septal ring factor EnvC (AmiA/AmiB activator)
MWPKNMIYFCLVFAFCLPVSSYAESSLREDMQKELLTLKVQLINCQSKIDSLKKQLQTLQTNDSEFIKSLQTQLAEQVATYQTLSQQLTDSLSYQKRLQTENTLLTIGIIGAGVLTVGAIIYAIAK